MRYRYPLNTRVFAFFQSIRPTQRAQPCSNKSALMWTPRRKIVPQLMDTTAMGTGARVSHIFGGSLIRDPTTLIRFRGPILAVEFSNRLGHVSTAEIPQRRRRANRDRLPSPILLPSDLAAWAALPPRFQLIHPREPVLPRNVDLLR